MSANKKASTRVDWKTLVDTNKKISQPTPTKKKSNRHQQKKIVISMLAKNYHRLTSTKKSPQLTSAKNP